MRVLLIDMADKLLGPVVAAALTREGATVVCGHGGDETPLCSRHYAEFLRHPPLASGGAFEGFMLSHAAAEPQTVLLPASDAALIALQPIRPRLDLLMPVAAAPAGATAVALDKARTLAHAATVADGLEPPPTIVPGSAEEAAAWPWPYPVLVKPRTGTGSEGIRLARDEAELRATYALVAARYDRPLVQMVVRFRIERKFQLFYLFDALGRLRSWYGQRTLVERHSIGLGTSARRVPGGVAILWSSWLDEPLLERGRRVMEALGWRGLGFIEGAYDERDGKPYLFEINARIGGTQALSLSQGFNFAHDACLVAQGRTPPERLRYADGVRAKRDPFSLLATRDPAVMLRILDPRWVASIPGLGDPRPVLQHVGRMLAARLRRVAGGGRATG